tara:strand:- start:1091 stop:1630 length:540 start_codon:yes stop_codon:yes gene_type:complete
MALFGSGRDASLIRSINNELITDFIDTEIEFYKLILEQTRENLYGESDKKTYYNPIKIPCIVQKDEKTMISDDYGLDSTRTGIFAFSKDYVKDRSIFMEEGDILSWDNEFYEIDRVGGSQYWRGTNPTTDLGRISQERGEFGYAVSIVVEGHVTRRNKLNLVEVRSGGSNQQYHLPKGL